MADKVDMSLDDIIKMNRQNKRQQQFKNGSMRSNQQQQRQSNRFNNNNNSNFRQRRSNPYSRPATQTNNTGNKWKHDLYDGNKPAHIMISNLHFRVSDNDIKELFKEFGQIKKAAVHYDKSGRSLGNAEVVFANKISARKAIEKYNDVQLDGRKMKITLVNDQPQQRIQQRTNIGGGNRLNQNRPVQNGNRNFGGAPKGGNRTNNTNNRKPAPTKEQLDADLDSYLNKS